MKIFLLLIVFAIAAMSQTKEGDTANGKRLFERNGCYQCHGYVGQGGTAGARLAQTKLPLAAFTAYVRNPASGNMPPFRAKVMSDQELADVYAYIKTFPEPKAAKDIPLLNQ
ncbi:MAG: cytochrome c [Acidobacteriota bacterium]|nr:cytochrome c [Acidobacteriota bacterium]